MLTQWWERCDENCRINMLRRPRAIVLKGEILDCMRGQKMCDCVIFRDDSKIILVELKSKNIEPRSIREKLTNGACAGPKDLVRSQRQSANAIFCSGREKLFKPCGIS